MQIRGGLEPAEIWPENRANIVFKGHVELLLDTICRGLGFELLLEVADNLNEKHLLEQQNSFELGGLGDLGPYSLCG